MAAVEIWKRRSELCLVEYLKCLSSKADYNLLSDETYTRRFEFFLASTIRTCACYTVTGIARLRITHLHGLVKKLLGIDRS